MTSRPSAIQQVSVGVGISILVVLLVVLCGWFADYVDGQLGHGPLPSGIDFPRAYLATLLLGVLGVVTGGAALFGMRVVERRAPYAGRICYAVTGLLLLALAITPLQRFGAGSFIGLPDFLAGVPARMVVTVALGALVLSAVGWRGLLGGQVATAAGDESREAGRHEAGQAIRGLPGRFTQHAWHSLTRMEEEAKRLDHAYMGTEHLLLGILHEDQGSAFRALAALRVDIASLRAVTEETITQRTAAVPGGTGMTRNCQRVIESAARISRAEGQRLIGTGHLLHALVQTPEGVAGRLLQTAGVTASRLVAELRRLGPEST